MNPEVQLNEERRSVMGQNDDGTPSGQDYIERRWVTAWEQVDELPDDDPVKRMRQLIDEA